MELIEAIAGLLMLYFIPGYLFYVLVHGNSRGKSLETFAYSLVYSLAIDVVLGLALGGTAAAKNLTGGVILNNVWIGLVSISLALLALILLKGYRQTRLNRG